MSLLLGIDTGGTYTDAVLLGPEGRVVASAKALTTKDDLARGVGAAIAAVLPQPAPPIGFVGLSTTLATNALVEGHGHPVGLLLIGQGPEALGRSGLGRALGRDPVLHVAGGHDASGEEREPLDLAAVTRWAGSLEGRVAGFAVAARFATRNPGHERAARAHLRTLTGLPVTCSHDLSSSLDAPRRALTALFNARLVPLLQQLILAVRELLSQRGIAAPLLVVKGDGALLAAEAALLRPVETILSGPAASVVGARHLSGLTNAVVADIGGTTTDIALLRDGRPALNQQGARVGGFRTMVEAVEVEAVGLGGDSELTSETGGRLQLGPRRAMPLSLLSRQWPEVRAVLAGQLARDEGRPFEAAFAVRQRDLELAPESLSRGERRLHARLAEGPLPLDGLEARYLERQSLERLFARGLAVKAAFTPSDAAHVLGLQDHWDREAAVLGARLWHRRLASRGRPELADAAAFAAAVVEQLVRQSAAALAAAGLAWEGGEGAAADSPLLLRAVTGGETGLLELSLRLRLPLIAVGAPARTYYPAVAARLGTELLLPPDAGVSNAVGAVAGGILERASVLVTQPSEGRFRVHLGEGFRDLADLEAAERAAEEEAGRLARLRAEAAGAATVEITLSRQNRVAEGPDGQQFFLESTLTATAIGRPRLAAD